MNISSRCRTAEGYSLGQWVFVQRDIRKGKVQGTITDEQIEKLDKIGMIWDSVTDMQWEKYYASAKRYYEAHHTLDPPAKYVDEDGVALGRWLAAIRRYGKTGASSRYLTDQRREMLENIGMVWDVLDFLWEQNFNSAYKYYLEHRHLDVPSSYVDDDGIKLGAWLARMRQVREGSLKKFTLLTKEQISRLDAIGMIWTKRTDHIWEKAYRSAEKYVKEHGSLIVPVSFVDEEEDIKLGVWIQRQRKMYHDGKLSDERKLRLDSLGMVWKTDQWLTRYNLLLDYYKKNGIITIPQTTVIEGVWLGKWIVQQYKYYKAGKLTNEQKTLLEKLPLDELNKSYGDKNWEKAYADAKDYFEVHGTLSKVRKDFVSKNGTRLSAWLIVQRRDRRLGKLSEEKIRLLDKLNFQWKLEALGIDKLAKVNSRSVI